MSKVLVLAPSGHGKTSSLRNLPPAKTGIINIDKKELPIKGWRQNYVTHWMANMAEPFPDLTRSNYVETSKFPSVLSTLSAWNQRPDIDFVAVDTATHLVTHDYVKNTIGKDFKAYQGMGKNFYELVDLVREMRKDVVIFAHVEKKFNEMGEKAMEMKSYGNMIKDMVPESFFTTVLIAEIDRTDGAAKYLFRTQSLGGDPAKSPAYFEGEVVKTALEMYEPNDMKVIFEKLKRFEEQM